MSTRTSNASAYILSVTLHAAMIGLIALFAYETQQATPIPSKILELVAGGGSNYMATVAPAIGIPGGIKVTVPDVPVPKVEPAPEPTPIEAAPPVPAQASPITPAPPEPKHVTKTAVKAPPKPLDPAKDLVAQLKKVEARKEARLMAVYKKQQEKLRQAELAREAKAARLDPEGIKDGVTGGSTDNKEGGAGGHAMTREEGDAMEAYIALLESRVKENHVQPDGLSDALEAKVGFFLSADGSISRVRIEHSSGNADFDHSVVEAFEKTTSFGPRPDHKGSEFSVGFTLRENPGE